MTFINEKYLDPISLWESRKKRIGATFEAWSSGEATEIVAITRYRLDRELPVKIISSLGVLAGNELTVKGIFLPITLSPPADPVDSDPTKAGKYRIQCQVKKTDDTDFEECNLIIEVI